MLDIYDKIFGYCTQLVLLHIRRSFKYPSVDKYLKYKIVTGNQIAEIGELDLLLYRVWNGKNITKFIEKCSHVIAKLPEAKPYNIKTFSRKSQHSYMNLACVLGDKWMVIYLLYKHIAILESYITSAFVNKHFEIADILLSIKPDYAKSIMKREDVMVHPYVVYILMKHGGDEYEKCYDIIRFNIPEAIEYLVGYIDIKNKLEIECECNNKNAALILSKHCNLIEDYPVYLWYDKDSLLYTQRQSILNNRLFDSVINNDYEDVYYCLDLGADGIEEAFNLALSYEHCVIIINILKDKVEDGEMKLYNAYLNGYKGATALLDNIL